MTYIISWTISPQAMLAATARFLETGGLPSAGIKMVGRWHGLDGKGVLIAETDNPKAIYAWLMEWSDLLTFSVTPALDDAAAGEVLTNMKR